MANQRVVDFVFKKKTNPSLFQTLSVALLCLVFFAGCVSTLKVTKKIVPSKETRSVDGRYVDHGNGTITDTNNGLMWTKEDSYASSGNCLNWNNSNSYVTGLNSGGHKDWRLPTVKELKTLFDKSKSNRDFQGNIIHHDPVFASGGAYGYWSSDTDDSWGARYIFFGDGRVFTYPQNYCITMGVRAVRK